MTDLERARHALADDPGELDEHWLAGIIAEARREGAAKVDDAWAAGRRQGLLEGAGPMASWQLTQEYERGAAEMRERAAQKLAATYPYYARLVRDLPLTPEEPARQQTSSAPPRSAR